MELKQIGRYEIQRRLGKGGMGSLYLARDPGLDRLVAIKLLKEDYLEDQEFHERFSREARALARLRHPNIVVVFDFGEHEGRPFMAMEYIDGETLRQRLSRTPSLKLALGLAIVEDLCAGLASAHDAGIVHRDIKPDNIMMDRRGVLKLLDFGIARSAHAESTHQMTQPGMIMGTYNYMSPEQLLGEMVDKRSDIFAVGAVLYQVIAREQAFPGAFGAVYHRVLTAGPVPLEQHVPGVDPTLVRIVMRALERDPRDRYQDANDMRLDLSRTRRRLTERGDAASEVHETVVMPRTPSSRRQKDSEAKRGLVAEQLRLGHEAFARGHYDIALQYGERAAFVDADDAIAIELMNKSRVAIDAKSVLPLLQEADYLLSQSRIQDAQAKAEEASAGVPDLPEAEDLRKQVEAAFDQILKAREREDRINKSLERARQAVDRREFDAALRAVYEVLALDPDRPQARELEHRAKVQQQAHREHERAIRDAYDRLDAARALADQGQFKEATAALNAIMPPSDTVRSAVADAVAVVDRLKRQAQVEEAIANARVAAAYGHFTRAVSIIDAIPTDELTESAHKVKADALESLAHQRELKEKQQHLEQLITSVDILINAGDATQARGRLAEAADLGLEDHRLGPLRRRLEELLARVEDQRRKQALDREVAETVEQARQLFTSDPQASVALLERSGNAHPDVVATLGELRERLAQIEERTRKERERQTKEARRAAQAQAERFREQERLAVEQQRLENEARELEQTRIATARQHLENEARERKWGRVGAERKEPFQETVVRPTPTADQQATVIVAGREEKERQPSAAPSSWRSLSASARAGIVLVAFALATGIGVGTYRVFMGSSTPATPTVSQPDLSTSAENVEIPARPNEAEKPVDVPPQLPPDIKNVESRGTVVLDALPWAEVVSIVDERGNRQEIPANSFTPLTLTLPGGEYTVTLRNGSTRTAKIRITNDGLSRMEPIDFGKVNAVEYFQRQGWQ
jgi:eukaryotic-like serine/threonine-protein kinase